MAKNIYHTVKQSHRECSRTTGGVEYLNGFQSVSNSFIFICFCLIVTELR